MSEQFKNSHRVLLTELGDGTGVLLHMDTKFYYTLNSTGVFIWHAIEKAENTSLPEVVNQVHTHFKVDRDQAQQDVSIIWNELCQEGLLIPG
jgi:hypothetical protein